MLTEQQFKEAAKLIGCEVASVKAVNEVEARGSGFFKDGRPKILFEGHIFWKQLLAAGIAPAPLQAQNKDILHPTWNRDVVKPLYNMDQYLRLEKARTIHKDAANRSASWGAFQIMGFNHKTCGYMSVQQFVDAQKDEYNQLVCFCSYLKNTHLDVNLIHKDWAGFARGYNGPEYTQNQYDVKLKRAYEKFAVGGA
jgi:hypothetical protein